MAAAWAECTETPRKTSYRACRVEALEARRVNTKKSTYAAKMRITALPTSSITGMCVDVIDVKRLVLAFSLAIPPNQRFQRIKLFIVHMIRIEQIHHQRRSGSLKCAVQEVLGQAAAHFVSRHAWAKDKRAAAQRMPYKSFVFHDPKKALDGLVIRGRIRRQARYHIVHRGFRQVP